MKINYEMELRKINFLIKKNPRNIIAVEISGVIVIIELTFRLWKGEERYQ